MSILEWRFVIVAWPPDLPETVFPKGWQLYPHSIWHFPVEEERCTRCGFTVKWLIWEEEFEEWNERIREEISYQLKAQSEKCLCPSHPKIWPKQKKSFFNPLKGKLRCFVNWFRNIIIDFY